MIVIVTMVVMVKIGCGMIVMVVIDSGNDGCDGMSG